MSSLLLTGRFLTGRKRAFDQMKESLSIGVPENGAFGFIFQRVIFTLELSESGFDKVVIISSIYGLGEMIVKGRRVIRMNLLYLSPTFSKKGFESIIAQT